MCRIASLFLLQRLKGSMSGDARDFNNMEKRGVIAFFFSYKETSRRNVNKNPTRCNSMQIFIYCKVTLRVSGFTSPIIRSTKTRPKEIHAILTETLCEHAPSYASVKNWVTHMKRGDFTTFVAFDLDDQKQYPPRRLLIKFMT